MNYDIAPIKTFLKRIRQIDLHQLADESGVNVHTLVAIRNRDNANPTLKTCAAIARCMPPVRIPRKGTRRVRSSEILMRVVYDTPRCVFEAQQSVAEHCCQCEQRLLVGHIEVMITGRGVTYYYCKEHMPDD